MLLQICQYYMPLYDENEELIDYSTAIRVSLLVFCISVMMNIFLKIKDNPRQNKKIRERNMLRLAMIFIFSLISIMTMCLDYNNIIMLPTLALQIESIATLSNSTVQSKYAKTCLDIFLIYLLFYCMTLEYVYKKPGMCIQMSLAGLTLYTIYNLLFRKNLAKKNRKLPENEEDGLWYDRSFKVAIVSLSCYALNLIYNGYVMKHLFDYISKFLLDTNHAMDF